MSDKLFSYLLPKKRTYAPHMNSEKQCKFKSTKAKRTASQPKLSKPSLEQIVQCKTTLMNTEPKCCGVCMLEDESAIKKTVDWVQCDQCGVWMHTSCTNCPDTLADSKYFLCHFCA